MNLKTLLLFSCSFLVAFAAKNETSLGATIVIPSNGNLTSTTPLTSTTGSTTSDYPQTEDWSRNNHTKFLDFYTVPPKNESKLVDYLYATSVFVNRMNEGFLTRNRTLVKNGLEEYFIYKHCNINFLMKKEFFALLSKNLKNKQVYFVLKSSIRDVTWENMNVFVVTIVGLFEKPVDAEFEYRWAGNQVIQGRTLNCK